MAVDGFAVYGRAIALVLLPMILRELFMQGDHILIATCFCQNAGGSYRCIFAIAFNDTVVFNFFVRLKTIAINQ